MKPKEVKIESLKLVSGPPLSLLGAARLALMALEELAARGLADKPGHTFAIEELRRSIKRAEEESR